MSPGEDIEVLYVLIVPESFKRASKRFLRKHPDLRDRLGDVLATLKRDPYTPSLRAHALQGELRGYMAVSLTYAYRIVITIHVTEREITLIDIGTHDDVY